VGVWRRAGEAIFFFRSKLTLPEGEGAGLQNESWQDESASEAFTPALILFIALPEEKDNPEPGVVPLDLSIP
jgi:hypothetical protein